MTTALVVGAASGLGLASARRLAQDGWTVAGLDRQPVPDGPCAQSACIDVRDESETRDAIAELISRLDRLDALICCAGISGSSVGDGPAGEVKGAAFDAVMDVNLRGTAIAVSASWSALASARGAIVVMSSVLGITGGGGPFHSTAYIASKGGLIAFTRALAAQGRSVGVRANCLAPGLVDTPLSARATTDPDVRSYVDDRQPLTGGPMSAEAVADVAAFLCSTESRAVTGQVIAVDAGWGLDPQ